MAFKFDEGGDSRRIGTSLAEINIIPLVDVVLVLLLIFMLTAPMMYRGIDVNLPKVGAAKQAILEERLVVTLTKDRQLFLNERPLPLATLEPRLRELMKDRTDKTIFIKADKELS